MWNENWRTKNKYNDNKIALSKKTCCDWDDKDFDYHDDFLLLGECRLVCGWTNCWQPKLYFKLGLGNVGCRKFHLDKWLIRKNQHQQHSPRTFIPSVIVGTFAVVLQQYSWGFKYIQSLCGKANRMWGRINSARSKKIDWKHSQNMNHSHSAVSEV